MRALPTGGPRRRPLLPGAGRGGSLPLPLLLLLALLLVPAAGRAQAAAPLALNVRDFGALGDGRADDTAAFQRALDQAASGPQVVLAPRGQYRFAGSLAVPAGVTLRGIWESVPSHPGLRSEGLPKPTDDGTTFLVEAGEGSETGPAFLTLHTNSTLKGVVLYYPRQNPAAAPTPYPYALALRGKNPAVLDVELLNPYNGIDASQNERPLIRNVQGQPLRRGLYVDAVYDIGRIENVHFNPWWSVQPAVREWMMAHGEAFVVGRSDWQYMSNTFCFGYGIGYRFIKTSAGHGRSNGNFAGLGADDCAVCVQVEACAPEGLLITNGEFVSLHGPDPTQVVVTATNGGTVRFVNCGFFGPSHQIARLAGQGTTAFSDCAFVTWDGAGQGRAAIQVASGKVQVRGCEFWEDKPQLDLGPAVQQAVITDCLFPKTLRLANHSRGRVRLSGN